MTTNHLPRRPKDMTPKKVKAKHPNIVALFDFRYRVIMNQMDTVPLAERREFGHYSSGDKKIDQASAASYVPVYLTINDMIGNFEAGVPMRLSDPSDSRKIFEAITNHTGAWRKALRHVMNVGAAPVEDLILLETFASAIYERAKFVYVEKPKTQFQQGTLASFLYSKNSIDGNMFSTNKGTWNSSGSKVTNVDAREFSHDPNIGVFRDILMTNIEIQE